MYHTVLLCYDGSPDGREALREGAEIARRFGAVTHLLAITPVLGGSDEVPATSESLEANRADFESVLQEGVTDLRSSGVEVTGHIAAGRAIEIIAEYARKLEVDLIVLGHRHQSRLARWWRGSVGASMVDRAPCSILIAVDRAAARKNLKTPAKP
jgi:nucleotide-binding universal stress UspA family protein